MVIGGGEIYKALFEKANESILHGWKQNRKQIPFSLHNPKEWHLVSQTNHDADEKNAYNYSFQVWEESENKK